MITVTEELSLQAIQLSDQPVLFRLMEEIYPSAYAHYWKDDCSWYLNQIYSRENLAHELQEDGGKYYFVRFRESRKTSSQIIGILKIIAHYNYPPLPAYKAFKIHRIYLNSKVQGYGIGKKLMQYAKEEAIKSDHDLMWLDAMDTHVQAQSFYNGLGYKKTDLQILDFDLLYEQHRPMWYMHKMLD